jgi:prevent-host-death family protein
MQTLTTMDLRKNLGHILDTIAEKNGSVTISRANKPLAVILSIAEYEEMVQNKN